MFEEDAYKPSQSHLYLYQSIVYLSEILNFNKVKKKNTNTNNIVTRGNRFP